MWLNAVSVITVTFYIFQVLEFAKMKKNVATELCDKEKIGDSFLVIGESYLKLRKFQKALKWCMKSLKMYKSLGNLEVSWCFPYDIIQYDFYFIVFIVDET